MSKSLYKATSPSFFAALQAFAAEVTGKFSVQVSFSPEDQLKGPMDRLLRQAAHALGLKVEAITEVQEKALAGRPDMGVATDRLLAGDWRKYLFPDADDQQFADAYAQTLTYALLLAQLSGTQGNGPSEPERITPFTILKQGASFIVFS